MKKIFVFTIAILCISSILNAQNLKLDEILEKYYTATGYDKIQSAKSIIMSGTITTNTTMPLKIMYMKPDKYKMEYAVQDIPTVQAYNGLKAWTIITPWTGSSKPQPMNEAKTKETKNKADYAPLFDWKSKGHSLELVGLENSENQQVYKLKLTRADGSFEHFFVDAKSFLLLKRSSIRSVNGKDYLQENFFGDYRNVNGAMFPFVIEGKIDGQTASTLEFETIETDKQLDEKVFEMPDK